jgi:hypothetical protein
VSAVTPHSSERLLYNKTLQSSEIQVLPRGEVVARRVPALVGLWLQSVAAHSLQQTGVDRASLRG